MKYLSTPKKTIGELLAFKINDRESVLSLFLYAALLLSLIYPFLNPLKAEGAVLNSLVRFDRMGTGEAISGTACLETNTVGTETGVIIDFPSDWTISGTASNWTVTTTNLPTNPAGGGAASAWPGINTATAVSGVSVRFPSTDLTVDTWYCFNFAGASSTVGAAGNDKTGTLKTQGGSPFVDQSNWATSVVSSDADQIVVTASVSATMTFSLSANTAALGTLVTSSTPNAASAVTQTVSTNAANGWVSWVKSGTDGGSTVGALESAVASAQIDSPGSFNGTPESLAAQAGYVLDVNINTCSGCTIAAEYNGADTSSGGHLTYNVFRQTASQTAPASSNTVDLVVRAKASTTTPAANDYTDTLTVVAAGNF